MAAFFVAGLIQSRVAMSACSAAIRLWTSSSACFLASGGKYFST